MKKIALFLLIAAFSFLTVGCDKSDENDSSGKRPDTVTVCYAVDGEGSIRGNAEQTVKYGKDATSVTAVAADGWVFVEWDDGYAYPTRTDVGLTDNVTFTAIFESDGSNEDNGGAGEDIPEDAPETPEIEVTPDDHPEE